MTLRECDMTKPKSKKNSVNTTSTNNGTRPYTCTHCIIFKHTFQWHQDIALLYFSMLTCWEILNSRKAASFSTSFFMYTYMAFLVHA